MINHKTIQRLWREEGLRVPARRRKRQRLGASTTPADRLAAEHPNHVWALDYQFDQTLDGRILKLLNVVDEHTRQALTITVARRHRRRRHRGCARSPGRRARNRPAVHTLRQRAGADRQHPARLVPVQPGRHQLHRARAHPGRTPTSRPSADACATSCSPSRPSAACWRPRCWSRTGESSTTPSDPTAPWATRPLLTTPRPGPPTTLDSHSGWTNTRGPVKRQVVVKEST